MNDKLLDKFVEFLLLGNCYQVLSRIYIFIINCLVGGFP